MTSTNKFNFTYDEIKVCKNTSVVTNALKHMDTPSTLYHVRDNIQDFATAMLNNMSKTAKEKVSNQVNNFINIINTMIDHAAKTNATGPDNSYTLDRFTNKILDKLANNSTQAKQARKAKSYIIKSKDPKIQPDRILKEITTLTKQDNSVQIDEAKAGLTAVKLTTNNEEALDKIKSHVETTELKDKLEMEEMKMLLPQISAVINSFSVETEETIKKRNNIPEEEFVKIVQTYDIPIHNKEPKKKLIIRLSRNARQILENQGRIYIGAESVPIKDNFYIRTCSNCLSIGHTSKFCTSKTTCGKCQGEHNTTTCNLPKTNICLLCVNNKEREVNHRPKSINCQAYIKAIKSLKAITDWSYGTQNN
uniref:Pre-C2HC domain-containing protein n=1 Tax=Tetranychus urticae TaxID=32264 RepID=A0A158P4I3_TETUR